MLNCYTNKLKSKEMRQIEKIFGILTFVLLIYTLVTVFIGFLDISFGFLVPNIAVIIVAGLLSAVIGFFGPFWNTGEYLKTHKVKTMVAYEGRYSFLFLCNALGCLGVSCLLGSKLIFDGSWWLGIIIIVCYLICTPIIILKKLPL